MPESPDIHFRRLRSADAGRLGAFLEANGSNGTTRTFNPFPMTHATARHLVRPESKDLFFGAFRGDQLVSFSMLRGWDEGYAVPSFGIITAESVRGQGIGRRLTRWTTRWADRMGSPKVRLTVFEDNPGAVKIYREDGFEVTDQSVDAAGRRKFVMHRAPRTPRTRVYASTACLKPSETFGERLGRWRDAGLFSIECGNYPGLTPDDAVAAMMAAGGDLLVHNYFPPPVDPFALNVASGDPAVRARSTEFVREAVKLTSATGGAWYAFHAGFCADPNGRDAYGFRFPTVTPEDRAAAMSRQVDAVRNLVDATAGMGVGLLVENNVCIEANRGTVLMADPVEIKSFFSSQGAGDAVGLLFDTGHWKVSARTLGFDPELIQDVLPFIRALHLHDNDGRDDQHLPIDVSSPWMEIAKRAKPVFVTLEGHYRSLASLQQAVLDVEEILT